MSGALHVVGVGPGDPELITLKAARAIENADVVAYPRTKSGAARARDIAVAHIRPDQTEFGFFVPMVSERGPAQAAYDDVSGQLAAAIDGGASVVLLCEGDPFFYGSAMYLYARLSLDHPVTVIPGVTSLTACAAVMGRPLAARNELLKVLPAPLDAEILARELENCEAAAIIKVGRHFEKVRDVLREAGLEKASTVIESATGEEQRVTRLDGLAAGEKPYFSTILVYRGGEAWA